MDLVKRDDDARDSQQISRHHNPFLMKVGYTLDSVGAGLKLFDDARPLSLPSLVAVPFRFILGTARITALLMLALFDSFRDSSLSRPPGYGLLWFADFFYSRKSVHECLRPTIQDLQEEYTEALAARRPYKARWVRIRGTWSFMCAAALLTTTSIGKQVVKIWRAVG